jgi:Family of unknown function (DUF5681)
MAQNSDKNSRKADHLTQHRFKPGQSGNPGGRPKNKPLTDLYEEILNDPKAIALVRRSVTKALSRGSMAMVLPLREMAERVEGKVTQPIEGGVTVNLADVIAEGRKRAAIRVDGRSNAGR